MIWFNDTMPALSALNQLSQNTLLETLDIRMEEIGDDFLRASMPVDHRTHQPYGLLHGGANVVLAESLGSTAGACCVDVRQCRIVGLDINANHLRSVTSGRVTGTATARHLGRSTQVWNIDIVDERGKLICTSRLTNAVIAMNR
ncbi:MAG: hotdog fold thioesterase [Pseudomonadota bacterium]